MAKFTSKYFYDGIPIFKYCQDHDINYDTIRNIIIKIKRNNPEFSNDEIAKSAIDNYLQRTKYMYGAIPLRDYCKNNAISYNVISKEIRKYLKSNPDTNLSLNDIVVHFVDIYKPKHHSYFIEGISLKEYCQNNSLDYTTIYNKILKYLKKYPDTTLSSNQIAELMIKKYRAGNIRYYYNQVSLTGYCKDNGLTMSTIVRKYHEIFKGNEKNTIIRINNSEMKTIIESIKADNGTIYFINDISLRQYCLQNDILYQSIASAILELKRKNKPVDIKKIIDDYLLRKQINIENKEHIQSLTDLRANIYSPEYVKTYCLKYNISINRVKELMNIGCEPLISINMIYYCSDLLDENGLKSISNEKVKEIIILQKQHPLSLDDLLLLNGIGFEGYQLKIVKQLEGYIINLLNKYHVKKYYYEEYKMHLEERILEALELDFTNKPGHFINYLKKVLPAKLLNLLYQENLMIDNTYDDALLTNQQTSIEDSIESSETSSLIDDALSDLTTLEKGYITKRFGFISKPMSIVQLQKTDYPEFTIKELQEFEQSILNKLKNNQKIKQIKHI